MQKEQHMRRSGLKDDRQEGYTREAGDRLGVKSQQMRRKLHNMPGAI